MLVRQRGPVVVRTSSRFRQRGSLACRGAARAVAGLELGAGLSWPISRSVGSPEVAGVPDSELHVTVDPSGCHLPAARTRTDRPTTRRARLWPCVLRPCHDPCAILVARCPAAGPNRPCTPLRPYAAAIKLPESCFPTLPFHYNTVSPTICEPPCSLAAHFSNIRLCSASVSFALPPYLPDIAHRATHVPFAEDIRPDTNSGSPLDIRKGCGRLRIYGHRQFCDIYFSIT